MEKKICTKCKKIKTVDCFKFKRKNKKSLRADCYECQKEKAQRLYRRRNPLEKSKCLLCNTEYESRKDHQLFCSEQCRVIVSAERYRTNVLKPRMRVLKESSLIDKKCTMCGAMYKGKPYGSKYCSVECCRQLSKRNDRDRYKNNATVRANMYRGKMESIKNLGNWYIKCKLSQATGVRHRDIPVEVVELKREQLRVRRLIKEIKYGIKETKQSERCAENAE